MERLTKKHPHGGHYMSCENCEAACRCRSGEDCMVEAISKLAAYEDSGLSPAEVSVMDKVDRAVIKGMKAMIDKGYGRQIPVEERLPEEEVDGYSVDVLYYTPYDQNRQVYAGYDELKPLSHYVRCPYPWDCGACDQYDGLEMVCKRKHRPPQSWCYLDGRA